MASIALRNIRCIDYLAYVSIFTRATFRPKIKLDVFFPARTPGGGEASIVSTSFTRVLDTSLFFSSTYVELYVLLRAAEESLLELVSRLGTHFRHTMVAGGFGPYQAHRRHPHTMGDAACAWFGLNPPGGRVVSTPPPNAIMSFFLCMHVVDYFVEYIHIFDTLLINYVPKFPPCLRCKRRCCCRPPPSPTTTTTSPSCRRRRRYSAAKTKALDYDDIADDGQGMVVVVFIVVIAASAATVSPLPLPLLSPSLLSSSSLDRQRPPI
jgi:hypothetical protein